MEARILTAMTALKFPASLLLSWNCRKGISVSVQWSRVVFQIDIEDTKTGKTLKKGYFRGTIITNHPKEWKYTVLFDDGDERPYDYNKHPIERTMANDDEYVDQCNNTSSFMATLDLSEAVVIAESE